MTDDRYSRLYWRFRDEFRSVYADDAAYALWCRLLVEAEMSYPTTPSLPYGTKARALSILEAAGLVTVEDGGLYQLRGLEKERTRRAARGRAGAKGRWQSQE
jgi:hypothetical protein